MEKDELKSEREDEMVTSTEPRDWLLSFVRKGNKFFVGDLNFSIRAESIDRTENLFLVTRSVMYDSPSSDMNGFYKLKNYDVLRIGRFCFRITI